VCSSRYQSPTLPREPAGAPLPERHVTACPSFRTAAHSPGAMVSVGPVPSAVAVVTQRCAPFESGGTVCDQLPSDPERAPVANVYVSVEAGRDGAEFVVVRWYRKTVAELMPGEPGVPGVPGVPSCARITGEAHSFGAIVSVAPELAAVASEIHRGFPSGAGIVAVQPLFRPVISPVAKVNVAVALGSVGVVAER